MYFPYFRSMYFKMRGEECLVDVRFHVKYSRFGILATREILGIYSLDSNSYIKFIKTPLLKYNC